MSFEACAALVERGDPERFRAVMAAPVKARQVLFPLYAFNIEVSRAPWVTQEPMIAEMRLQWWRDALAEIAAGGLVRRHEVVTPLALVLTPDLAKRLDVLVAARRMDIARAPFDEQAQLERYLSDTSGVLTAVVAEALGADDTDAAAERGYAIGVANWLRAVPALEAHGKVPLVDGRGTAVAAFAKEALERWQAVSPSKETKVAVLTGWLAPRVLAKAASEPGAVAAGALEPGPMRASASLMRAAWRL